MDTRALKNARTRRTTLTLEADVADYVEDKLARNKKLKEKAVINDLIRKGIRVDEAQTGSRFSISPFRSKLAKGMTRERLEELSREI
jgi:hypothetical protein